MSLFINTNIASLNAQRNLANNGTSLSTSLQRLSSGLRINSAKDDAAGLAISDRFTTQINGLNQAVQNANDGISLAQTAEGALQEVTNNLQRIRQLAVQSANATNSASDRQALDSEVQQRIAEINRIATQTSFNNQNVLDGTFGNAVFQVGANVGQTITVGLSTSSKTNAIGSFVNSAGAATQTPIIAVTGTTVANGGAGATYAGVSTGVFDGSSTYQITPNGGVATTLAATSSFTGSATGQDNTSAYAKAGSINGSGISGVTASGVTTLDLGNALAGKIVSVTGATAGTQDYNLQINGVSAYDSGNLTGAASDTIGSAISQINQQSNLTGVVASQDSTGGLLLTAADGRNIALTETITGVSGTSVAGTVHSLLSNTVAAGANTAAAGTSTATYRGQVTLQSKETLVLNAGAQGSLGFVGSNLQAGSNLAAQNVTTVSAADSTILAVDSAITAIDNLRGTFGAIQNRFQSTIANLSTTTENLSAARSRILDADFAQETSNLTRAQILQQAGTSVLAQANALPQGVLKLLQ